MVGLLVMVRVWWDSWWQHGGMVGDGEGMVGQLVTAWRDGW